VKLSFFAVPALDSRAAQDALNAFLSQHRVAAVDRQLVTEHGQAFWAVCVTTTEGLASSSGAPPAGGSGGEARKRVDYREVLSPADFGVYTRLRDLRQAVAEAAGVPVYTVFTNEQLAAMVQQRVTTKAALGAIAGIGEGRIEKHAEAFLAVLRAALGAPPTEGA
jgi:superfamily II DNA helicase RecQ